MEAEDKEDDLEGASDRKTIFFVCSGVPEEAGRGVLLRGKGCHEELRQALNIMSNCVTRSKAEEITQFRIMYNVQGPSAPTVIRETELVRSLHLPLGGWEGLDQHGELTETV